MNTSEFKIAQTGLLLRKLKQQLTTWPDISIGDEISFVYNFRLARFGRDTFSLLTSTFESFEELIVSINFFAMKNYRLVKS